MSVSADLVQVAQIAYPTSRLVEPIFDIVEPAAVLQSDTRSVPY